MKQLVCEMCGSTDLVKQDGVFVCQTCGCKYSVEEARKMMVEGTVEVAGTVKVDNTELIGNYFQMADNALEAGNHAEAENYANKVIELEPRSYRAWCIKGIASGWQTTNSNNRFPESINSWINAFHYATEEEKIELEGKITENVVNIGAAIVQMHCKNFENNPVNNNRKKVIDSVTMLQDQLKTLKEKTGIDVFNDAFSTILARMLNSAAVNASNSADKEFGPEKSDKSKYAWERYLEKQDNCLHLLSTAEIIGADDDLCFTACKNYLAIAPSVRDSCSYKYYSGSYGGSYVEDYSLTDAAKKSRSENIMKMEAKKSFYDPDKRKEAFDAAVKTCDGAIGSLEEEAARKEYWKEHSVEKRALDEEKGRLQKQLEEKADELTNNPLHEEAKAAESSISSMESQLNGLGLFKGKEKKALQGRIEETKNRLSGIRNQIKTAETQNKEECAPLKSRIKEIDEEITKERGRIPTKHGNINSLFDEEGNGFSMSPRDLYNYMSENIPHPYVMETGDKDIKNQDEINFLIAQMSATLDALLGKGSATKEKEKYVDDPKKTKEYCMYTYKEKSDADKDKELSKIRIYCHAKAKEAPMENEISFELRDGFSAQEAAEFSMFVSAVLFDFLPSTKLTDLQTIVLMGVYGIKKTKKVSIDGAILRFIRSNNVVHVRISKNILQAS